jgi:Ca2+-binding EF-hand superfamily protein
MEDAKFNARREAIVRVFNECDTDHNKELSFEEVYRFLCKKNHERTGERFDYQICEEFFRRMGLTDQDSITIN